MDRQEGGLVQELCTVYMYVSDITVWHPEKCTRYFFAEKIKERLRREHLFIVPSS
jgi:hypothetical protein